MSKIRILLDSWGMQTPVSVSQLAGQADLAWSCGQCPLDGEGRVQYPDDLLRQSALVANYISELLARVQLGAHSIARLTIYYVHRSMEERLAMIAVFRDRLGEKFLVAPVAVPHFYYDGMLLEVDMAVDDSASGEIETTQGCAGVITERLAGGTITWGVCTVTDQPGFEAVAVAPANALISRWFQFGYQQSGLDRNTPVVLASGESLPGLAFVGEVDCLTSDRVEVDSTTPGLDIRSSNTLVQISAVSEADGLLAQTRESMRSISEALEAAGLGFADVVKLNAFYAGDSSADDLHGNMKIRHSYYSDPGPASTGLPVAGFRKPGQAVAIDVLAMRG